MTPFLILALLASVPGQDPTPKQGDTDAGTRIIYRDWAKGIDFRRDENGHITLTAPDPKEESSGKRSLKTYEAKSMQEFKSKYPDVAKRYDLDRFASPQSLAKELEEEWQKMTEGSSAEKPEGDSGKESWIDRHQKQMEKQLRDWDDGAAPSRAGQGKTLGILVAPVPPALRSQLGLPEDEGLVIHRVQVGSLAEKSGLQQYDVIRRLNDRPVRDSASFRKDVEKALSGDRFSLDILRGGKPSKIEINPSRSSQ